MQIIKQIEEYNKLQSIYGDKNLDAVYGCGEINNPNLCLVFMNPTGKNVSANKNWQGLKAPWLGTKHVWNMLYQLGLFSKEIVDKINSKKISDYNYKFAEEIYKEVCKNSLYITNLSKATQADARALPNEVFRKYMDLFKTEMSVVKPKIIITFGNQVSSILLNKNIKVSDYRKKNKLVNISGTNYKIYPIYYPVGQGMRNIAIAKEDISWILKKETNNNNP